MPHIIHILYLVVLIATNASLSMADTRIKDIASVDGIRENQLVGYGLVVGLNGTGDNLQNSVFTQKGIVDFLERVGVNIQGSTLKTKNIAAVTVTANLPAFARQGSKVDVRVSAIGDAKSIRGGTLLATPLLGADGDVYVVAQGRIVIPEFQPAADDVKTKTQSVETNGFIQDGGIVENEIDFQLSSMHKIIFSLHYPDFTTALSIADAINNNVQGNTATAKDSGTVEVLVPNYKKGDIVEFISQIEVLPIQPDYKAKVVINESTGTIVIGDNVHIRPVAIAQGNLVINISDKVKTYGEVVPLLPKAKQDDYNNAINKLRGEGVAKLDGGATLSELVSGLNKLGVWPRDIINILNNMRSVGAIDAVIEVR